MEFKLNKNFCGNFTDESYIKRNRGVYQLVEQEKAKNDALLQKQIELEQKSSEYQNLLNGLNTDN